MAAMVRQRTHERRVRAALGATARDLRGMVMRRGLAIAIVGATIGVVASLVGDRFVQAMLYDVSPTDPATLGIVAAALLSVAAAAIAVPARASTRVDAAMVLRDGT